MDQATTQITQRMGGGSTYLIPKYKSRKTTNAIKKKKNGQSQVSPIDICNKWWNISMNMKIKGNQYRQAAEPGISLSGGKDGGLT